MLLPALEFSVPKVVVGVEGVVAKVSLDFFLYRLSSFVFWFLIFFFLRGFILLPSCIYLLVCSTGSAICQVSSFNLQIKVIS